MKSSVVDMDGFQSNKLGRFLPSRLPSIPTRPPSKSHCNLLVFFLLAETGATSPRFSFLLAHEHSPLTAHDYPSDKFLQHLFAYLAS